MTSSSDDAHRRMGLFFVAASAMLFASKGLFGKALYQRGVSFELLVTVRALLPMPFFLWFAARANQGTKTAQPSWRAVGAAVISGVVCYYAGAMVDFWALTMIDASIERVLLFSYPAVIVVMSSILKRQPPQPRIVAATLLTYLGIFLVMGGIDLQELRQNLFGAALVLVAAVTTAIYFLISERYTVELGSTRFVAISMGAAAVALTLHFLLFRSLSELAPLTLYDWWLLLILGTLCMFVPGLLQAEGVRRVGAQAGAIASTVGPPTTILLAAIFFGERLNAWQWLGSAVILGSVLVLSLGNATSADKVVVPAAD